MIYEARYFNNFLIECKHFFNIDEIPVIHFILTFLLKLRHIIHATKKLGYNLYNIQIHFFIFTEFIRMIFQKGIQKKNFNSSHDWKEEALITVNKFIIMGYCSSVQMDFKISSWILVIEFYPQIINYAKNEYFLHFFKNCNAKFWGDRFLPIRLKLLNLKD